MSLTSINKVSIRYRSGGHSFSTEELKSLTSRGESLEVVVVTPKCVLVPASEYLSIHKADYLCSAGLAPEITECIIDTPAVKDIIAVLAIDKAFAERLFNLKADITFSTPLLSDLAIERGTLIELIDDVLYLRIYNNGLLFAEAMEIKNDTDIIHILQRLHDIYDIYNTYARALGDVERITRVCKGCFKHIDK